MEIILFIILLFFAFYGFIDIILGCAVPHDRKYNQCMVIQCDNDDNSLECDIRTMLKKYPECDIFIVNECSDNCDINKILENFDKDYPQIHILKKTELPSIFD